jgi:tripartite-type tricarboxylate transporter receptor subunit TctC
MRQVLITVCMAVATLCTSPAAVAQTTYPDQPIKWVVPYPAGGGTDNLARTLAESMRGANKNWQVVVDNKPGASTNVGADFVARAKPDGYTVISADNGLLAFNEYLFKKLPFDPKKDFTYIGGIGKFPITLAVHPDFPAKNLKEFMDYVKARPGKVDCASPGNGTPHHLALEIFKNKTGLSIVNIPYRGAAAAMQDLMAGQVQVMFLDLASGLSIMKSGKVRVLAIGSSKRSPLLPDVPTFAEAGMKDMEVYAFQGLMAPAGLPTQMTQQLNLALNAALKDPMVLKRFTDFGFEPLDGTPDQFYKFARAESARWGPIIKANNISMD